MQFQFNAQNVPPSQPFEPVPVAWYPAILKKTEPKETKARDGSWYIHGEFEIIDGQYKGRKVFQNFNVGNKNQQAVEIAQKELSAICHVTGRYVINDTDELCNIPMQIKVSIDGNQNRIDGYKDMNGNDPGKAGQPAAGPQAMPPAMPPAQAGGWQAPQQPAAAPQMQPQAPQGGQQWGAPQGGPAPAPAPAAAGQWGAPQGGQHPAAAPAAQPPGGWGGQAPGGAPQFAPPPSGAPAWGNGAPAPAAPAQAPAQQWAPGNGAGGAPAWARS